MEWYYILVIVLGILGIIVLIFYWYFKSNLTPTQTGILSENIVCIKNSIVNVYIYSKGSDRLVIDAGFSAKALKKELIKMEIVPEEITEVFLTHTDPDHIGGLSIFSNAKVYVGEDSRVKNEGNFVFLSDNDIILVGEIKVQAISSPGHRLGHICYLIDDKNLFTGDLLRIKAGEIRPFFKRISIDPVELNESIKKIAQLKNVKMLLTAHTGYTTEFDKLIEKWK